MPWSFPFGANITGYDNDGRTFPRPAVLCPVCVSGIWDDFWAQEAETADALDREEWERAAEMGLACESCGLPARDWLLQF